MSDSAQLLPCPFCGRAPVTERTGFTGRAMYVYCISDNGCPCPKAIGESEEKAIENWNTRAAPLQDGVREVTAEEDRLLRKALIASSELAYDITAQVERAPEGYAIVPILPTPRMIEVGCDNNPTQWNDGTPDGFAADVANDVYVAMVRSVIKGDG